MNKKGIFKIIAFILLLIVIFMFFFKFSFYIEDNEKESSNNIKDNNSNIQNKDYKKILTSDVWVCFQSYLYMPNNEKFLVELNPFKLNFSDTEVEMCLGEECDVSPYQINNDILTIPELQSFSGIVKIILENDYLILETEYDTGSKIHYYFDTPKG